MNKKFYYIQMEGEIFMSTYWVFTFPTTHLAIKFDQVAKQEQKQIKLIPLPRKIGASCGFCGKVTEEQELSDLIELCYNYQIEFENIYEIKEDNKEDPRPLY